MPKVKLFYLIIIAIFNMTKMLRFPSIIMNQPGTKRKLSVSAFNYVLDSLRYIKNSGNVGGIQIP